MQACDGGVEAEGGEGVGAGDDDDVAAGGLLLAGVDGGADAREVGLFGDKLFVGEVAAAFVDDLVLEVEGGDAGGHVLGYGAAYLEWAWGVK